MQEAVYTSGAVTNNGGFGLLEGLGDKLRTMTARKAAQLEAEAARLESALAAEGLGAELPDEPAFSEDALSIDTVSMDAIPGFLKRLSSGGANAVSGAHLADEGDHEGSDEPAAEPLAEPLAEPVPGRVLGVRVLEVLADLRERGHAVAVGKTVFDLAPEVLEAAYALADRGHAHLWAEAGGIVLATANSTAGDRRRAATRLPEAPATGRAPRSEGAIAGKLLDGPGGDTDRHYSEEEGWGISGHVPTPKEAMVLAADEAFRAARFRRASAPSGFDVSAMEAGLGAAHRRAAASDRARADEGYARYHEEAAKPRALAAEAARLRQLSDGFFKKTELSRMRTNGLRLREGAVARRRAGRPLTVRPAAECSPELQREGRELASRRSALAALPGRPMLPAVPPEALEEAAYRTAAAILYARLDRVPRDAEGEARFEEPRLALARKALHLIRRDGGLVRVSRLEALANREADRQGSGEGPRALLKEALRALSAAGAVRARRDEEGAIAVEATRALDKRRFGRELVRVVAEDANRIPIPEGSRLERLVAAERERRAEGRAEGRAVPLRAAGTPRTPVAA